MNKKYDEICFNANGLSIYFKMLCIKNGGFRIKTQICIKNDGLLLEMMNFVLKWWTLY